MRVTMNLFSGRPNPTWSLTPSQAEELVERLAAAGPVAAPDEPPLLGFRGFTLNPDLDDVALRAPMPAQFVVPPPAVVSQALEPAKKRHKGQAPAFEAAAASEAQRAATDVSQWLLATAVDVLGTEVLEAANDGLRQAAAQTVTPAALHEEAPRARAQKGAAEEHMAVALGDAACEPFLTPISVAFWNNPPTRFRNNCYNYATNFASNTMAQPGRRSGHQYTSFDCGNVSTAAQFDGYLNECRGAVRVVALAIWPGFDFHWWRLHPGGFWAHKIGTSPVFQWDNLGRILGNGLTPENCDRGPYTQFCGFFYAPLSVEVL
jgi:hypothetical protein